MADPQAVTLFRGPGDRLHSAPEQARAATAAVDLEAAAANLLDAARSMRTIAAVDPGGWLAAAAMEHAFERIGDAHDLVMRALTC